MNDVAKLLPSVDQVLQLPSTQELVSNYDREWVVGTIREVLQAVRGELFTANNNRHVSRHELLARVETELGSTVKVARNQSLHRAINATGVILHTGLGRAPLPPAAQAAVAEVAEHYSNLELDLDSGERGSRLVHVGEMICKASGAEAAAVVNNNAAAVMLMLNCLARDREVIISRGELVEIGGAFRIPDIIAASGARLREVGTTNRTHRRDYEAVVCEESAVILSVHPSNYRVRGFTASVSLPELAEVSSDAGIPLIYDLGGGAIVNLEEWDLPHEPMVGDSLKAGADLVSFSGDKVLGGPQAGIIAGRAELVRRVVASPMMRALRCDKLTMAALEGTLRLYRLDSQGLRAAHPVLRMMTDDVAIVRQRADRLIASMSTESTDLLRPLVEATKAEFGSGALPLEELPSAAVCLRPTFCSAESLAQDLRTDSHAVVGRIHRDVVVLDMRTVRDDEVAAVVESLERMVGA